MTEAAATITTINKLLRWGAVTVVVGGIGWAAHITTKLDGLGDDVAVLKSRDGGNDRTAQRVSQLEQLVASMGAAREQMNSEYRMTVARLEGQIEGQRRDIQTLSAAIAALTAEVKANNKER